MNNLVMIFGEENNRSMIDVEIADMKSYFASLEMSGNRIAALIAYIDASKTTLNDLTLAEIMRLEEGEAPACAWPRGELIRMCMYNAIRREFSDLVPFLDQTPMSSGGPFEFKTDLYEITSQEEQEE
jgi:hypothetical protein